jgi:hypothetical protein
MPLSDPGGDLFTCPKCGGARDFTKRPRKFGVQWVCYGCRIKAHCTIDPDDPDACWLWTGAKRGNYGIVRVRLAKKYSFRNVHRVAYAVWTSDVPHASSVLHTCGQKLCCNPKHLYLKEQPLQLGNPLPDLDFGHWTYHDKV